jgi:hypothetical protein
MSLDPQAAWNPTTQTISSPQYPNPMDSPRVILVGLFSPQIITQIQSNGNNPLKHKVVINDFALFFLQGYGPGGNQAPVQGRFLTYATGSGVPTGGQQAGALIRVLQLIR